MVYFKLNGETIEKYSVRFDKEEIEKLKETIIDKCSYIKHIEYESDYYPSTLNWNLIKNFHKTYTGRKQEYFEETRDICCYSYDEYKPPYLVELIDQFLNNDVKVIDKILNYDFTCQIPFDERTYLLEQEINLVNHEFNEMDAMDIKDIKKRKSKLEKLEKLLTEKEKIEELNKNQQSIDEYYKQLLNLIQFDLIDSLPINDLNKIENFFDIKCSMNPISIREENSEQQLTRKQKA